MDPGLRQRNWTRPLYQEEEEVRPTRGIMMDRTFVMVKPDGVARGLVGEVVHRLETKGLKLVASKMMTISHELASKHYAEHVGKPFYDKLISYITSGPVAPMVFEGKDAYVVARQVIGATHPGKADMGTIRGDLCIDMGRNVVHGSDSLASAEREISLFFDDDEIVSYIKPGEDWIYE